MKNNTLAILCSLISISLFAQAPLIQNGLVREQNSGKKPVSDVQIIFSQAVPATSDQAGKFRLTFAGKKAGDLAFMSEITKKGYELVNDKELEHVKLSNTDQLGTDVIVAKAGTIDAAKKTYYNISDQALKSGFEKQKAALRGELDKARLSEKQFQDQYEALQKQYENQKKELDNLSEKFAKVNFDDVSALYQEALQLFKDGKIDDAIKKLEGADLNKQTAKIIQERKSIEEDKKALTEREAVLTKKQKEQIEAIQFLAQMYMTQLDISKAETQYDQLLLLDSTNLDILSEVADFYRENHRYEKALSLYPKIIAHPQTQEWQKGNAHSSMGDLYKIKGDLDKATYSYAKNYELYALLSNKNHDNIFYKANLAIAYEKIGNVKASLGDLQSALSYYKDEMTLFKTLYTTYPNKIDFKKGLAIAYSLIGTTYMSIDNSNMSLTHLDTVLSFYKEFNRLEKELYSDFPNNLTIKKDLAISNTKLGEIYTALNDLDKALYFFEERHRLGKELFDTYPNNLDFKEGLAISYSKLGETYTILGKLDKALICHEEEHKLFKELNDNYPSNISFKNGLAITYAKLGELHLSLGNFDKALVFYEQDFKLSKVLYNNSLKNLDYKTSLAVSNAKLGLIQLNLNNYEMSAGYFNDFKVLFSELAIDFPTDFNKASYAEALAVSTAMNIFLSKDKSTVGLTVAKDILNTLYNQSNVPYFKQKKEIIDKMLLPSSDLKKLIVELSIF